MKFCPECGTKNKDTAKFCEKCGSQLSAAPGEVQEEHPVSAPPVNVSQIPEVTATPIKPKQVTSKVDNETASKLRQVFNIPRGETIIASIGNNLLQNVILGGAVKQSIACFTPNRLYYQGHTFNGSKKSRDLNNGSVLLRDISYTGIIHTDSLGAKIKAVLVALAEIFVYLMVFAAIGPFLEMHPVIKRIYFPLVPAIFVVGIPVLIIWYLFKKGKTTVFKVAFPGAELQFNINFYAQEEVNAFKDAITEWVDHAKGVR